MAVSDTGTGIPAAELPKIFRRFERVEGATGRSIEGTGIGLALVQELVKIHGGKIAVESEEGVRKSIHGFDSNWYFAPEHRATWPPRSPSRCHIGEGGVRTSMRRCAGSAKAVMRIYRRPR